MAQLTYFTYIVISQQNDSFVIPSLVFRIKFELRITTAHQNIDEITATFLKPGRFIIQA